LLKQLQKHWLMAVVAPETVTAGTGRSLALRRPLLPYGYSYKAFCIRPG